MPAGIGDACYAVSTLGWGRGMGKESNHKSIKGWEGTGT